MASRDTPGRTPSAPNGGDRLDVESRLRLLADNGPDVIFCIRLVPSVEVEYVSAALKKMVGYDPEEYYRDPSLVFGRVHDDDRAHAQEMIQARNRGPYEIRLVRRDGTVLWTEHMNTYVRDDGGEVVAVEGIMRDVSDRKRMEEALRESEQRFKRVFERCPIPGLIFRADDLEILDANESYVTLFEVSREALIGAIGPTLDIFPDPHEPEAAIARLERDGELRNYEMNMRSATGKPVVALWSTSFMEVDGERRLIAMANDVTELREAEAELQRLREDGEAKAERALAGENQYNLTFREFTVLNLLAAGRTDKEIAAELVISPLTVHKHVSNILSKMDAQSRTEASTRAMREGLVE